MPGALLSLALAAAVEVPAGASAGEALARARPGDVVRLAAGTFREALDPPPGVSIAGAGPERTVLVPPEGMQGVRAAGRLSLTGLSVRAGPARCALAVVGGAVDLRDVVLSGGSCGAFVEDGSLRGEEVELRGGEYGILVRRGEASLSGGSATGGSAGAAVLRGRLALSRVLLFGPSREAGLSVAGGEARLDGVLVASPGPAGIAVSYGGRVEGRDVSVGGTVERGGFPGACVQVLKGEVRLASSELLHCGGAALEASGGTVALDGVEAEGGTAGCLVLLDGARAELQGNHCAGRGPGLVAASGSTAALRMNQWSVDPVFLVECETGSRVRLVYGPRGTESREPCSPAR